MIKITSKTLFAFGWKVAILSGCFPFTVGLFQFINLVKGQLFTLNPVFNKSLIVSYIGFVNLSATGLTIIVLSWFGLRQKVLWAYIHIIFLLIWVGGNDSFILVYSYLNFPTTSSFPIAVIPTMLGILSVSCCMSEVMKKYL